MFKKISVIVSALLIVFASTACRAASATEAGAIKNGVDTNVTSQNNTASQDSTELSATTESSDATTTESVADFHNIPIFLIREVPITEENNTRDGEVITMNDSVDELIMDDVSKEKFPSLASSWDTYMFDSQYEVTHLLRRCDSHYVSVLDYTDISTGGAHSYDHFSSHNFDVQTGEEIALSDVISDQESLTAYIKDQLANISEKSDPQLPDITDSIGEILDDPTWVLEGDGITIYLGPYYDMGPYSSLNIPIFIPYSSHMIDHNYAPIKNTGYITSVKSFSPFLCDLENDGTVDEIYYTRGKNPNELTVYINDDPSVITIDNISDSFVTGYLAVTPEKKHFLLMEGHDKEPYITVIDIEDGTPTVAPLGKKLYRSVKYTEEDTTYTYVPTNTESISLSARFDLLSTYDAYKYYSFTENGKFITDDEFYMINMPRPIVSEKEIECNVVDQNGEVTGKSMIPSLTDYTLYRTDGYNYVDAMVGNGKLVRLDLEHTGADSVFSINIAGTPAEDLFEMLFYTN